MPTCQVVGHRRGSVVLEVQIVPAVKNEYGAAFVKTVLDAARSGSSDVKAAVRQEITDVV